MTPSVTPEALRAFAARIDKARKAAHSARDVVTKAELALSTFENTLNLDYLLKRNGRKFQGTNDATRKAELIEALNANDEYQRLYSEVEKAKRKRRDADDAVSELEDAYKAELQIFERETALMIRSMELDNAQLQWELAQKSERAGLVLNPPDSVRSETPTESEPVNKTFFAELG